MRTFFPSASSLTPTRSALAVAGLKIATLDWSIGIVLSTTPPVVPFIGLGLTCFLTTLTPSTIRCWSSARLDTTPRLPLSRPAITITWSPLRILFMALLSCGLRPPSEHFGRERDDLHETLAAQLARHRPEDPGADRLELVVQQHGRVTVELDQRSVGTAHALGGAHHDRAVDLALLDPPARRGFLDRHLDDVADAGVAPLRPAEHLDAHDGLRAGVVGDIESRLHLDHLNSPT